MLHRHLSVRELRGLMAKGWRLSSHSMTHGPVERNLYQELMGSRLGIEEAAGCEVFLFLLPESETHVVQIGAYARQYGYLAMFTARDAANEADDDLFYLGRVALIEEGAPPRRRHFDPYDRLLLARDRGGWVVDSTQYATPEPIRLDREITLTSLARRFEKVREVGDGKVWCATPEEVVEYVLTRRATRVVPGTGGSEGSEYMLSVSGLSPRVKGRTLTFCVTGLRAGAKREIYNLTTRQEIPAVRETDDALWFEVEVVDGLTLRVPDS